MSATTFDLLYNWIWPRPGESSPSEEAGLTPTPPVYIATAPHVHIPFLDSDSNCETVLSYLQSYRRSIYPSCLTLLHRRHFFLIWRPPHLRPIYIQLLVREQVQAMRAGFISDHPEATWTGDRWVGDGAYISLWGPGFQLSRSPSHIIEYRFLLERATKDLCNLLHLVYIPRNTAIHLIRTHQLETSGNAEDHQLARTLREEHARKAKHRRNVGNRQRKRLLPPPGCSMDTWAPAMNHTPELGSGVGDIKGLSPMTAASFQQPTNIPDKSMTQTPELRSGVGDHDNGTHPSYSAGSAAGGASSRCGDLYSGMSPDSRARLGSEEVLPMHSCPNHPNKEEENCRLMSSSPDRWQLFKPTTAIGIHPCQDEVPDSRARLGSGGHLSRGGSYPGVTTGRAPFRTFLELPADTSDPSTLRPRKRRGDLELESQALRKRLQEDQRKQLMAEQFVPATAADNHRHPGIAERPVSPGTDGPGTQSWLTAESAECVQDKTKEAVASGLGEDADDPVDYEGSDDDAGSSSVHLFSTLPEPTDPALYSTDGWASMGHAVTDSTPSSPECTQVGGNATLPPSSTQMPDAHPPPLSMRAAASKQSDPTPTRPPGKEEAEVAYGSAARPRPPPREASDASAFEELPVALNDVSVSDSTEVNLAAGDDLQWATTGCQLLTLRDVQHDMHRVTLRTSSCQSGCPLEPTAQHEIHESLVDAFVRTDQVGDRHFLASYRSQASDSIVLTSFADDTGIVAMCLLRSTSQMRSTRSPPSWTLELINTKTGFRSRGFGSALLRCAMSQAMRLLPGQISSRPGFLVSNLLTHHGFEQLGPTQNWLYQHLPLLPGMESKDLAAREPLSFCTDRRVCYILSCIQIISGQPGVDKWLLQQTWPHSRVGYSLTMLLAQPYGKTEKPSTCVSLAILHSYLVRQNKCMRGHSQYGTEDQDGFDLFLALLSCLDRELGPELSSPLFRVDYEHAGTCAATGCPDSSSRAGSDRAIRIWVPPAPSDPCRLESLLESLLTEERRECACPTCHHSHRKYSFMLTNVSGGVAFHFQRGSYDGRTSFHTTPVILPTQLILSVGGAKRILHLRTVLLICEVQVKPGVLDPHWMTVTHRLLKDKPHQSGKPMWFLASDHYVTPLGNLGAHVANETLSLDHVTLQRYQNLSICGAFYSDPVQEPLLRSLNPCGSSTYDTPILDDAMGRLRRADVRVAPCPKFLCATPTELRSRVTTALLTGSPVALKAPYLRKELTVVDASIRSQRIALTRQGGVKSKAMNFTESLANGYEGWGHAEALDRGLQSQLLHGGSKFAHDLGTQLGVTLADPAGVVVTTDSYVTDFHFHLLPVLNCGIVTGAGTSTGSPWQTVGLYEPRVLKTYLFASVEALKLLGLSVTDSGSMDISSIITRLMRLPINTRRAMQFDWAIMDGVETTHIIFPEQTLHWVATESARGRRSNAVYCRVGSFFLPNDIEAARRLRQSLEACKHYRHTAKQKPSPGEAIALVDAHIAALAAQQPTQEEAMVTDRQNDASNPTVSHA